MPIVLDRTRFGLSFGNPSLYGLRHYDPGAVFRTTPNDKSAPVARDDSATLTWGGPGAFTGGTSPGFDLQGEDRSWREYGRTVEDVKITDSLNPRNFLWIERTHSIIFINNKGQFMEMQMTHNADNFNVLNPTGGNPGPG